MESTGKITINFEQEGFEQCISVTQYDTGKKVRCNIAGISGNIGAAMVYCKKPSGLETYTDADIVDDHTVEFYITEQMNAETGCAKCQLQLFGEDKSLTSYKFKILVQENMIASSRVTSADDYPAFRDAIEKFTGMTAEFSKKIETEKTERQSADATEKSERQAADAAEKTERMQEISVERARINNLVANNNPTEGNSELIDMRIGYDGTKYGSAGEAVRGQVSSLSEDMITFGEECKSVGEDPLTIGSLDPHKSYLIWSDVWKTISDISEELKNIKAPFVYLSSCVFVPGRKRTYSDTGYSIYMFIVYPSNSKTYSDIVLWSGGKLKKVVSVGVTEETIINCDNVSVLPTMHGVENILVWGATNDENRIVNITENNITISSNGTDTGSFGVCTRSVLPGNYISAFVYLNINVNSGSVSLFISGYKKSTGEITYILIKTYEDDYNGFEYLDIVYHNIYNDLDLSKPLSFILSVNSSKINDVEIITFQYNLSTFTDTKILGENLSETIEKIDAELNNKMNIGSTVASDNTLISPDGNRFIPTISNDGIVSYTPIVPSKTLFIGNSLLLGWGTFGMCALDSSHDYYHYVSEYIKNIKSDATFDKISGTTFESATSEDAADSWMHDTLSEKLSQDIELVLIQLSDNVNTDEKNETFKLTCAKLIQYIRTQCPKARVAWVSAWYYTSEKQNIISEACNKHFAKFISITNLAVTENRGSIGDEIHKDDGSTVTVDSSGVASHPGNKGMRLIANRILYDLGISDTDTAYDESYDN